MSALLHPPQEFDGNLTTALCAVDLPGKGWVSGYQLSAGAAACTVAVDGAATISTTYACGCMAGNQMQGLTPPDAAKGETCDSACGQVCWVVTPACKLLGALVIWFRLWNASIEIAYSPTDL